MRPALRPLHTFRLAAALLAALAASSLLAGCLKHDETPDAETQAAVKAVNDARAEQAIGSQRAKDADEITSAGK